MILHTIVPLEQIFDQDDKSGYQYREIQYLGQKVIAYSRDNSNFYVSRVISTDPFAYLDSRLQPGSKVPSKYIP